MLDVIDTPSASPQWSSLLGQIKTVGYKYLAIAHNRSKGRL